MTLHHRIWRLLCLSHGGRNERVRVADLHELLRRRASPREVNAELRAMQERGDVVLMPLENPRELHERDRTAAVDIAGDKRHLVFPQCPYRHRWALVGFGCDAPRHRGGGGR